MTRDDWRNPLPQRAEDVIRWGLFCRCIEWRIKDARQAS